MIKINPLHSPDLFIRFNVRRFTCPSVVYLQKDFWNNEGIDIEDPIEKNILQNRLLEKFAVSAAASEFHPPWAFKGPSELLYADRYGAAQGMLHGGSGRCGTNGNLNAKGIGRTPLCNMAKDWYHTHGCVWMEEAIRETIYSNVAAQIFPNGATPVVAIIDTGEQIGFKHQDRGARRAIIVRPIAFRLAHLERSIYFGAGGLKQSEQFIDAKRTKQCIMMAFDNIHHSDGILDQLEKFFLSITDQISFGQVHRIFQGDYHSSNVSINGELIDFGASRMVPDWRRRKWDAKGAYFGDEHLNLTNSIYSILFQCKKYICSDLPLNTTILRSKIEKRLIEARKEEISRVFHLLIKDCHWRDNAIELINNEFERQQALPCVDHTASDIYEFTGRNDYLSMFDEHLISEIEKVVAGSKVKCRDRDNVLVKSIRAWGIPIVKGYREAMHSRTNRFLKVAEESSNRSRHDYLIEKYVSSSIRYFINELSRRFIRS